MSGEKTGEEIIQDMIESTGGNVFDEIEKASEIENRHRDLIEARMKELNDDLGFQHVKSYKGTNQLEEQKELIYRRIEARYILELLIHSNAEAKKG